MAGTIQGPGPTFWRGGADEESYRTYKVTWRVRVATAYEGPATAMQAPGLPYPGAPYVVGDDVDIFAWCRPEVECEPELEEGEPNEYFNLTFTFSNKPLPRDMQRCADQKIEDPLLEPAKVSGSFVKKTEMGLADRFGRAILNSAHEQIDGPQNEWDSDGGDKVTIEMNVADLALPLLSLCRNSVNSAPLWGMPPRCVKLSEYAWEKKWHGLCYEYYTWKLEFEINSQGFDRDLLDEGTKVINGRWGTTDDTGSGVGDMWEEVPINGAAPDANNPQHFIRAKDRNGENMRMVLDGAGRPADYALAVTGCSECPAGSPQYWFVRGFPYPDSSIRLTHSSGCLWAGTTSVGSAVSLQFASGDWFLSSDEYEELWRLPDGVAWVCAGPNVMTPDTNQGGPKKITLVRGGAPGLVHVEKYREVDFLGLLGLPATF